MVKTFRTFCRFGCYKGEKKGRCPECRAVLLYETADHPENPFDTTPTEGETT